MKKKNSEEATIKSEIEAVLKRLEVEGQTDLVVGDELVDVVLETKDTGVVIGYHGEVLEALQLILSLCVSKKLERFVRISLEVGDYKKNRVDYLKHLAAQTKERAIEQGSEVALPNLKSWERRVVHLFLQDDTEVVSESVGEGRERTLVIKPRS